jgi:hypothetical protein
VDFSLFKIQDSKLSYAKSLSWIHTAALSFATKKRAAPQKRNDSQHYEEV